MPLRKHPSALATLLALACATGCHLLGEGQLITEQSLLKAAAAADDAVTLDIFWVELPSFDAPAHEDCERLWNEVREDRLPVDLRERLACNGLRAGVVGAKTPDALLRLLDPNDEADVSSVGVSDLRETGVRRRTRQMRPGESIELNASQVVAETPLLVAREGRVTGREYRQAQGVYVLGVEPLGDAPSGDQRVTLRLQPEVRHGDQQLRFVSDETGAITRGSLRRESVSFADLAIEAELGAGEMLLVTGLPESGSRLGGLFHERDGQPKAILVRVAQAPATRVFAAE